MEVIAAHRDAGRSLNLFMHVVIHSFVQWNWSNVIWEQRHWLQGQVKQQHWPLTGRPSKWLPQEDKLKNILENWKHEKTQKELGKYQVV